jgi:hypothetical protein
MLGGDELLREGEAGLLGSSKRSAGGEAIGCRAAVRLKFLRRICRLLDPLWIGRWRIRQQRQLAGAHHGIAGREQAFPATAGRCPRKPLQRDVRPAPDDGIELRGKPA